MSEVKQMEDIIIRKLVEHVDPIYITIFGSFANGTERRDSDVDIAFLPRKKISHYETFMLAQEIADQIKREVDLINLREATTVMQAQKS